MVLALESILRKTRFKGGKKNKIKIYINRSKKKINNFY